MFITFHSKATDSRRSYSMVKKFHIGVKTNKYIGFFLGISSFDDLENLNPSYVYFYSTNVCTFIGNNSSKF